MMSIHHCQVRRGSCHPNVNSGQTLRNPLTASHEVLKDKETRETTEHQHQRIYVKILYVNMLT